jgi:hypothetical protein
MSNADIRSEPDRDCRNIAIEIFGVIPDFSRETVSCRSDVALNDSVSALRGPSAWGEDRQRGGTVGTYRKNDAAQFLAHKTYDSDVRNLEPGDEVEVYVAPERAWASGTFDISTAGVAYVELRGRAMISLDGAILMGLRRVVREAVH